jgi:hypothetical protein
MVIISQGAQRVSDEFGNKSDLEIQALIGRAEHELERRNRASKDKLKEEIEEKLKASGLELSDFFPEAGSKGRKARATSETGEAQPVKAKYRDPVVGSHFGLRISDSESEKP